MVTNTNPNPNHYFLFDDCSSTRSSRLYTQPVAHYSAYEAHEVSDVLDKTQADLRHGLYAITLLSYELGEALHHLNTATSVQPLMQSWLFDSYQAMTPDQVRLWIDEQLILTDEIQTIAGVSNLNQSIQREEYIKNIQTIFDYIKEGQTYQVNYTYRITGQVYGHPLALYRLLRQRQSVPYGAYISHPQGALLSFSPECFLRKNGAWIEAEPMKGTSSVQHQMPINQDPKNRAENLMIVDLLRNDLSKIALPGTVKVDELFKLQQHGQVIQMTSHIQATAKPHIQLNDILAASFPCGSVTGAPKLKTMELIRGLEKSPRNYYCGSLGWIDPPTQKDELGNFCLNVLIRSLEVDPDGRFTMGIGSGITIDSNPTEEWDECQLKAQFLTGLEPAVGLFETILVKDKKVQRMNLHLDRMMASALDLGIPVSRLTLELSIYEQVKLLESSADHRLKLSLNADGSVQVSLTLLDDLSTEQLKIVWADELQDTSFISSRDPLLRHKVTRRAGYDAAWKTAMKWGAFDAIFCNEHGYVTEGGRSNIFIRQGQQWITPALHHGLLPGIMRGIVLATTEMNAIEGDVTKSMVMTADEIILCNSLRGAFKVTF